MPLLSGLLLLSCLALLSAALGRRLLLWLRLEIGDVAERGLVAIGLGLGALQFLPFLLFTLQLGFPGVFRLALALLALALLPDSVAVLRAGWRLARTWRVPQRWQRGLIVIYAALLVVLFLRAVCPCAGGDALTYHIPPIQRYLSHGSFVYLPTITYTNWPMGSEILLALVLSVHPLAPLSIVAYLMGLLLIATVALFARSVAGNFAAVVALCLLLLAADIFREMTTVMVDVALAAYSTLAIFALTRAETDPTEKIAWQRLAAIFAGLAATMKLTGIWLLVAFYLIWAWKTFLNHRGTEARRIHGEKQPNPPTPLPCRSLPLPKGRGESELDSPPSFSDAKRAAGKGAGGLGLLVSVGIVLPWYLKTWALTGNPFYPMFYNLFGGREWTPTGWERFHLAHLVFNTLPGLPPTPQSLYATHRLFAFIGVTLCLLILRVTRHSRFATPLGIAAVFMACISLSSYLNGRFLLPVTPTALVCLASVFGKQERRLAPVLCLAALVLSVQIGVFKLPPSLPTATKVALGLTSREAYLRAEVPIYELCAFANAHLSPDDRILLGGPLDLVALYRPEALWGIFNLQDSIHYNSEERLEADLRRLHVGYLALTPYGAGCVNNHNCRQRMEAETEALHALALRRGIKLFEANGSVLYRLNLSAP